MADSMSYKILWSDSAKQDLKNIYNFVKKKFLNGAKNVIFDIKKAPSQIKFPQQTQIEEYFPKCRRIIVRNYKLLYQVDDIKYTLSVIRIFDTLQNPNKLKSGDF